MAVRRLIGDPADEAKRWVHWLRSIAGIEAHRAEDVEGAVIVDHFLVRPDAADPGDRTLADECQQMGPIGVCPLRHGLAAASLAASCAAAAGALRLVVVVLDQTRRIDDIQREAVLGTVEP